MSAKTQAAQGLLSASETRVCVSRAHKVILRHCWQRPRVGSCGGEGGNGQLLRGGGQQVGSRSPSCVSTTSQLSLSVQRQGDCLGFPAGTKKTWQRSPRQSLCTHYSSGLTPSHLAAQQICSRRQCLPHGTSHFYSHKKVKCKVEGHHFQYQHNQVLAGTITGWAQALPQSWLPLLSQKAPASVELSNPATRALATC